MPVTGVDETLEQGSGAASLGCMNSAFPRDQILHQQKTRSGNAGFDYAGCVWIAGFHHAALSRARCRGTVPRARGIHPGAVRAR